ncbi:MAG: NADH:ubiquinone reductase (Na(+)-transporting) subunit B [Calditrichaeota bacterium]|nr:MAG: NADH:ubiquinone reductase (Na(+)-transporting) subunit B [Calditrichota bacterium]
MKFLRKILDKQDHHFQKGGKLEKFFAIWEMQDTILYTPGNVTKTASHVRDKMDLKRMMILVYFALIPTVLMALYNTGLQANLALAKIGGAAAGSGDWHTAMATFLGIGSNPENLFSNLALGALYFLPIYLVAAAAGGFWEILFAIVRKHEVTEGFLVTSLLFPLILPATIPLWQVALGMSFGVVIGKEVFGGVGMNILNPALTGRAFLFFAYPAEISGDAVWVAVDGHSQATALAQFADTTMEVTASWMDSFIGTIPGSMGETSALACLIGAFILIVTRVGSWQIMLSVVLGMVGFTYFLNFIGSDTNPMFAMTPEWHFVVGGFAFGTVFMATDPVTAAITDGGKWIYGFMIGILVVLVRVINPAFPEGMMLAILFANVFAPIFDKIYLNKNIKRRLARNAK